MSQQPQDIRQADDTTKGDDDPDAERAKHWPAAPIEELDDQEREMLLQQAGPTGEMARHAWQQYQEREEREHGPGTSRGGDEPQAVAREAQRLQEMGQVARERGSTPTDPKTPMTPGGSVIAPGAGGPEATKTPLDEPVEDEAAETGSGTERERAEKRAGELGLEVRDYGTAGDWRVYDPATGRQVAKSTVLG